MAAPTSATDQKVPDWAVKNRAIFLSCQKGAPPHRPATHKQLAASSLIKSNADRLPETARSMAVEAADPPGRIRPPTVPPSSNYFRDVANHPDVLSTIISTAREYVGFPPPLSAGHMTPERAEQYIQSFNDFIRELDRYYVYMDLESSSTQTVQNNTIDCTAMLNSIVTVLATALKVPTSGAAFQELTASASALIQVAINGVSQHGKSTNAGFEMLGLAASNVEGQPPIPNPTSAVTYTLTTLSRDSTNKSTVEESFLSIACYTYTLKSSAIINYADYLQGSVIVGNKEFVDTINKNL